MAKFNFNDPVYRECTIEWLDSGKQENVLIAIGGINPTYDDDVFFDCLNEECFDDLKNKDNGEDFYIVEVLD